MSEATRRLRGLAALVGDAVDHGSTAVQRVHLATAGRTFTVLEAIAPPARAVHTVYDALVSHTYANVRRVNRVVGAGVAALLDEVEAREERDGG